ncbi:hypothetical protein HELRODRAFT_76352 [Helobdella robusta]|uniref:Vesicle transport through interaction with t-SNAREs homolog 1A n=1 Tax=Helobdella robusta TaxID=6412 RepID=T1G2I8_HELRO|nr:hypothetical protein HELRODRAFT_76352 [Helobdella robusta]ESO07177.1 hypothetical protein HELRODRAFT_76352 [Helobdella robusta]
MADTVNLIETYEQQFSLVTAEIISETNKLNRLTGHEKQQATAKVERLIQEANELLEQLELEVRGITQKERDKYQTRLKSYEVELIKLEKDFKKSRVAMSYNSQLRDELFGNDDAQSVEDMRTRLLDNNEKLEKTTQRLDDGYKICLETEQIGAQILDDLNLQRSTIQKAKDRLYQTNEELGRSSRVLTSMMKRTIQNRVLLIAMGLIMFFIICITLYFIFRPH